MNTYFDNDELQFDNEQYIVLFNGYCPFGINCTSNYCYLKHNFSDGIFTCPYGMTCHIKDINHKIAFIHSSLEYKSQSTIIPLKLKYK